MDNTQAKTQMHHTEADLDNLIEQKLQQCSDYPHVCRFLKSSGGPERVKERIKEIIFNDGNSSIESTIAIIETELIFE